MQGRPHCRSTLVSELRTSSLGPKQYYELYMSIFDALRHLSVYLRDSHPTNHLADLYELVQYAGNVVPRLYLMITVGTVYMSIPDAPVKEIMKDMMEMSRGVQHPVRGLFLRYYLSGQARDCLPQGSGDGPEGNLQDSVSFVLTNFVEMNKLWVRLQHQGPSRERDLRTKERQELQLLVGSNLVRLSQLVDLQMYKNVILQPLLEQVVQCRDVLAQEYLLEVMTQVFPDEFHLHTLDHFLSATARLNPHVNVKGIVIGLMDRLSAYAQRESETAAPEEKSKGEEAAVRDLMERLKVSRDEMASNGEAAASEEAAHGEPAADGGARPSDPESKPQPNGDSTHAKGIPDAIKLFEIFYEQVVHITQQRRLPIQDITALLTSLANLTLTIYPHNLLYIDRVLAHATTECSRFQSSADLHSPATQGNLLALLQAPTKHYTSLFTALALPSFLPLFRAQTQHNKRAVAGEFARSLLRNNTLIRTPSNLDSVLQILNPLIAPLAPAPGPRRAAPETEEVVEEQGWLARLVHLVRAPSNTQQFALLQKTRTALAEGGERTKYTTPALLTASLRLARSFKRKEHLSSDDYATNASAVYKFAHTMLSSLYTRVSSPGIPDLCLRLFVSAGQVSAQCGHVDISYEFFAQAFTVYEEAISDSRGQFQAICVIAGGLSNVGPHFVTPSSTSTGEAKDGEGAGKVEGASGSGSGREEYDTLITKCALHGSKLLKKPDQCRGVYLASHLWWGVERPEDAEKPEAERKAVSLTRRASSCIVPPTQMRVARSLTLLVCRQPHRDGKRVLECLQRALRVADACMDTAVSVELFVEILNRYVYYFDQENEAVTVKYLNGLIELIQSNLGANVADGGGVGGQGGPGGGLENARRHFRRTLEYIESRGYEGVNVSGVKS